MTLREDVKFWLHENKNVKRNNDFKRAHENISRTIQDVRKQQQEVLLRLENDYNKLQGELSSLSCRYCEIDLKYNTLMYFFSIHRSSRSQNLFIKRVFRGYTSSSL